MKSRDINSLLSSLATGIIVSVVHLGWFAATLYGALWAEWRWGAPDNTNNDGGIGYFTFVILGICLAPIPVSCWIWVFERRDGKP